jgi:hypothetical protein
MSAVSRNCPLTLGNCRFTFVLADREVTGTEEKMENGRIVLRHDASGLYYSFTGNRPHVALYLASTFRDANSAAGAAAILAGAGRGTYSVACIPVAQYVAAKVAA